MLIDYNYKHEFVGLTFSGFTSYTYTAPKSNRGIIFKTPNLSFALEDDIANTYAILLQDIVFSDPDNNEVIFNLNEFSLAGSKTTASNIVSNYYYQFPIAATTNTIATTESNYLVGAYASLTELFIPIKFKKLVFVIGDVDAVGLPANDGDFNWGSNKFIFSILY